MNVLVIGNSFSQDAAAYLHQAASSAGKELTIVNLYIGGCPLERHWQNIESDRAEYEYQLNGHILERRVSIRQAVMERNWDVIVTQQVSHDSGWAESYEPFLTLMCDWLREKAPRAALYLHQTWAYEQDSDHNRYMRYHRNQEEMYRKLTACYHDAAQRHGMRLIPSGDVIQALRQTAPFRYGKGGMSLCRDGYHMHLIYGRYALACTWALTLYGVLPAADYLPVSECDPSLTADADLLALIRRTAQQVCAGQESD